MKFLILIVFFMNTSFESLAAEYNGGCDEMIRDEINRYSLEASNIDVFSDNELNVFAFLTTALLLTGTQSYNTENSFDSSEKLLLGTLGAAEGIVLGRVIRKSIKKKKKKKKGKDIKKILNFMKQAKEYTGSVYNEVLEEVKKENPYIYKEELTSLAYELFFSPPPNVICPMGESVSFKKFVEILRMQAGLRNFRK